LEEELAASILGIMEKPKSTKKMHFGKEENEYINIFNFDCVSESSEH